MNQGFSKRVMWGFLVFLLLLSTGKVGWAVAAETDRKNHLTEVGLPDLVREYVATTSSAREKVLLKEIQRRPEASIESATKILQERPPYGAQPVGAQPKRSVSLRGAEWPYALYVPEHYQPGQAYPLILCLHGAGFSGEAYLERWVPRLEEKYILACPSVEMGAWWTRFSEELVLAVLRDVEGKYHVDPDRIFLTGMSNGGIGTWIIGMHHADRFAGIAPMASGIDDVLFPFVGNLRHTPVYVIHGAEDQVMPVQLSRDLVKEMERRGVPHYYREHQWTHPHAGGHFFPRQELPDLMTWFDGRTREFMPQKVSLVRDATHLTPFYWVRIDTTDPIAAFTENLIDVRDEFIAGAVYAGLQAEIIGPNRIAVQTDRIRRFTLFLNKDLVDFSRPVVVEANGRVVFQGMVEPQLDTLLREARHRSDTRILYPATLTLDIPQD